MLLSPDYFPAHDPNAGIGSAVSMATDYSYPTSIGGHLTTSNTFGILNFVPSATSISGVSADVICDIYVGPSAEPTLANLTKICSGLIISASELDFGVNFGWGYCLPLRVNLTSTFRMSATARTSHSLAQGGVGVTRLRYPPRIAAPRVLGEYIDSVGVDHDLCRGTVVESGSSGAFGPWTYLGDTNLPTWWWQVGFGISNAATNSLLYTVQLGALDPVNPLIVINNAKFCTTTVESVRQPFVAVPNVVYFGAGVPLFARIACSGAAQESTYVAAYGVGG